MKKEVLFLVAAVTIILGISAVSATLRDGLMAYYELDETSGTVVIDSANGIYNGTRDSGVTQGVAGKIGNAYRFNGDGQGITLPYHNPPEITITMWVYLSASLEATPIFHRGGYLNSYANWEGSNLFEVGRDVTPYIIGGSSLPGHWVFLTIVADSSNLIFYVNGTQVGQANIPGLPFNTNNFEIGKLGPPYLNGIVDEVGIWNRSLNDFEVSQLYNNGEGKRPFGAAANETDLYLTNNDIYFSDENPIKNQTVYITAIFYNALYVNPPIITVGFYDGHPNNGTLIGYVNVTNNPRENDSYFAQIAWQAREGAHDIYVSLDPFNEIPEADESNNLAYKIIHVRTLPDLSIRQQDIGFTNPRPRAGERINILAMIHNIESEPANNFTVSFYLDSFSDPLNPFAERNLNIGGHSTQLLIIPWTAVYGYHKIYVYADSKKIIQELNEANNIAFANINVSAGQPPAVVN